MSTGASIVSTVAASALATVLGGHRGRVQAGLCESGDGHDGGGEDERAHGGRESVEIEREAGRLRAG